MNANSNRNDPDELNPAYRAKAHLDDLIDTIDTNTANPDLVVLDERLTPNSVSPESSEGAALPENATEDFHGHALSEEERVTSRTARLGERILNYVPERNGIRLLIFTRDTELLNEKSLSSRRLRIFAASFSEIHVVILNMAPKKNPVGTVRFADNVWLYHTNSAYWWKTCYDAYVLVNEQLVFAGGFRADIILAEDAFESALAGRFVAKKYARPFQIHVLEDFFDPGFKEKDDQNVFRIWIAGYTLRHANSVRTKSSYILTSLIDAYPEIEGKGEELPIYHNLEAWRELPISFDLKERYPQFKFIMLHISSMHVKSHSAEIIRGASGILRRYPTLGLVILGNGPQRDALEKQVIELGIQNQIEFEPIPNEVISHMKTANILIHLSEDSDEEETILQAASVRLPMILGDKGLGSTLFVDGESALVCAVTDPVCVGMRINRFLNENQTRAQIGLAAQEVVFERIEQDYGAYMNAYRKSIERGLVT